MTDSRTLFLLLAEFGTGHIPVERCAHHFDQQRTAAESEWQRIHDAA